MQNGPPVYMSVAGYMGLIKKQSSPNPSGPPPSSSREREEQKYGNLEELEAMFSSTGGVISA